MSAGPPPVGVLPVAGAQDSFRMAFRGLASM